jgi:hypothetical protein
MIGNKRGAAGADLPARILPGDEMDNKKSTFERHLGYEMKSI